MTAEKSPQQGLQLTKAEQTTLQHCLRNISVLEGCETEFRPHAGAEGSCGNMKLKGSWGEISFQIYLHLRLTPKTSGLVLRKLEACCSQRRPLLFSDFLPENLAARLRAAKLPFMDSCGNTYLHHSCLHVEIAGRKRKKELSAAGRPFQQAGLKLISVLLTRPEAVGWTCRRLAKEAGIALGAVSQILKRMEETGYLSRAKTGYRILLNPVALLQRWELGFAENLRAKLLQQTCRFSTSLEIRDIPRLLRDKGLGEEVLIGGELGAHLLLDHPAPQSTVFYLPDNPLKIMLRLQLVPDPAGNVDLMRTFSPANRWEGWQPEGLMLADPLLMHADMAARGILSPELGEKLMNGYLLPRLEIDR